MKHLCKNCNNEFEGKFCNQCGQNIKENNRLSSSEAIKDFVTTTLSSDKILIKTFIDLVRQPGMVGLAYIRGQRKKFVKPIQYLVIMLTLVAILDWLFVGSDIIKANARKIDFPFLSLQLNHSFSVWVYRFGTEYRLSISFAHALLFPAALMLVFRKYNYSFIELLSVNYYYFATGFFLVYMMMVWSKIFGSSSLDILTVYVFFFVYMVWAYYHFYDAETKFSYLLKIVWCFLLLNIIRIIAVFLFCWLFPVPMNVGI